MNSSERDRFDSLIKVLSFSDQSRFVPDYIKSSYEDAVWVFDFNHQGGLTFSIDFNVELGEGRLTDAKNSVLLETYKAWIIIAGTGRGSSTVMPKSVSVYQVTRRTLHLIDYFILNDRRLGISRNGFASLSPNEIGTLLIRLAKYGTVSEAVYDWTNSLKGFLKSKIQSQDLAELQNITSSMPTICLDLPIGINKSPYQLSVSDTVKSRCYLWANGLYSARATGGYNHAYVVDTIKLTAVIYNETLIGVSSKPRVHDLCLEPISRMYTEYPRIIHSTDDSRRTDKSWFAYLWSLKQISLLGENYDVPRRALQGLDELTPMISKDLKPLRRVATLSTSIIFDSLRKAIEFYLVYGEFLFALGSIWMKERQTLTETEVVERIKSHFPPAHPHHNKASHIKYWSILLHMRKTSGFGTKIADRARTVYSELRNHAPLCDLIVVLYGAITLTLGTLMARRQSELVDLPAIGCLDDTMENLVFFDRKSGVSEFRSKLLRPIPPIAGQMIQSIIRFQTTLIACGVIPGYGRLLSAPSALGGRLVHSSAVNFNRSLDRFCDYIETPLSEQGERHYIREHQLRRFFAQAFFWGNAAGGMNTLRWFLGHTDVEHLYNYITEITPGDVLRSVKASYVASQLTSTVTGQTGVIQLLEREFHTSEISILDPREVELYIEDLIKHSELTVEPVFYEDEKGKAFTIAIVIT